MQKTKKKILASILAFLMVFTTIPVYALEGTGNTSAPMSQEQDIEAEIAESTVLGGTLTFSESGIEETVQGQGYTIEGTTLEINSAGVYTLTGECSEGSVKVKASTTDVVLVLDGLNLASTTTAPIEIKKNADVKIHLNGNNSLTDAESDPSNEKFEGAAIKVKTGANLLFCGQGELEINGSAKNGIKGAAEATITFNNGNYSIFAANNGIASDGELVFNGGTFNISAQGDAIKSNPEDTDSSSEGRVTILGGNFEINSDSDGINAEQILIEAGNFNITTAGGSDAPFDKETLSAKGIKASTDRGSSLDVEINGGTFTLNCADDCIHSDGSISIARGIFDINSGDDAIHADGILNLGSNGGLERDPEINIQSCVEGIEGGEININSGRYYIFADDDAINAAEDGQRNTLTINDCNMFIICEGDGLDSNKNMYLNGGFIEIFSRSTEPESIMDTNGNQMFISGATVFGAGLNSKNDVSPSDSSQSYITLDGSFTNGNTVAVMGEDENMIYGTTILKNASFLFFSSPSLSGNETLGLTDASVANMGGSWSHDWYVANQTSDTITYASDTTGMTESQSVFNTEDIICNGHEPEVQEIQELVTTFNGDAGVKQINVFYTQDYTAPSETDVQTAIARNASTGRIDDSGSGQVNFEIVLNEGYELVSVEVAPEGSFNQLKDQGNNIYRITKVSGNNEVTITTEKPAPPTPDPYDFTVTYHALDGHFNDNTDTNVVNYHAEYVLNDDGETFTAVPEISSGTYEAPTPADGYHFIGWHLSEDLSDEIVTDFAFTEDTDLYAEYEQDDIQLSMIYYDSRVDGGRTALNENTPCVMDLTKLTGSLVLQVNYMSNELIKNYEPGEFSFKVYGLEQFGLTNVRIASTLFNSQHVEGTYNPETNLVEGDYYVFTNKTTLEEGSSVEGMIQLSYALNTNASNCPYDGSSGLAYAEWSGQTTNQLPFEFHLQKRTVSVTKYGSSLSTLDTCLGDDALDYYWNRYTLDIRQDYSSGVLSAEALEMVDMLPASCKVIVYDSYSTNPIWRVLEPTEIVDGMAKYVYTLDSLPRTQCSPKLFVGYPKSEYNVGDSVRNTVEWYGKYKNSTRSTSPYLDPEFLGTATSGSVSLVDNDMGGQGNAATFRMWANTTESRLTFSLLEDGEGMTNARETFSTNNPFGAYTVRIDVDKFALLYEDGTFEYLTEDEYEITRIENPRSIQNKLQVNYPVGAVTYDFYGRKRGETEFEFIESRHNTNSSNLEYIDVSGRGYVEYYMEIRGFDGTIYEADLEQDVQISKQGLSGEVKLLSSSYLGMYDMDGNYRLVIDENKYAQQLKDMGLPAEDLAKFGYYPYRAYTVQDIEADRYCSFVDPKASSGVVDNGITHYNIAAQITLNQQYCTGKELLGYHVVFELPNIMTVPMSEQELIDNLVNSIVYDSNYKWIANSTNSFNTVQGLREFLRDTATCRIETGTDGITKVYFDFDWSEEPYDISAPVSGSEWYPIIFDITIPVDIADVDILDYGGAQRVNIYGQPILPAGTAMYSRGTSGGSGAGLFVDTTHTDYLIKDTNDIDGDNDTDENWILGYGTTSLVPAFDAQQELSKLTKTDKNFWKKGASNSSADTDYAYRLRVRTAASAMTNLVIYDVLENHNPDNKQSWQGEFIGVDLSRSETQGYVPTVYYSTSSDTGKLGEDSSWQLYDESVDKSTVKALAFDYGEQRIQPNAIASVDILMHSPDEELDYYAYNIFNAEWNRVDPATDYVFPNKDELMSNATILAVSDDVIITDTFSLPVTKEWQGEPENFNGRPESITVNLYKDGVLFATKDITSENNWKVTFTGLEAFDTNGHEFVYTITENSVDGYISDIDNENFVVTNTYNLQNIEGEKHWVDDNADMRPESITVNLLQNDEVIDTKTVTAQDDWKFVFEDVEILDENKVAYEYSIEEEAVDGYATSYGDSEADKYDVYNTFINSQNIEGQKTWVGDTEDKRPESITVNLLRNGEVVDTKTVTADNEWSYVFEDVEILDENKVLYEYSVEEEPVDKYIASHPENAPYDIINTFNAQNIAGEKHWVGDNADMRPESITINLLRNDEVIDSKSITARNDWKYVFEDVLTLDEDGNAYRYSIEEEAVDGYTTSYGTTDADKYDVYNTFINSQDIEGEKIWVEDTEDKRPESITVNLLRNGEVVDTKTVTAQDDWKFVFEDVEILDDNKVLYDYSVEEVQIGRYITQYAQSATSTELSDTPQSGYFTIINTYDPPKSAEIRFTKTIQGTNENWARLALNKNDTYYFKIKLINTETGDVIQGVLTNKGDLVFGRVPLGTYAVVEADDVYFDFVSMVGRGQLDGVTFDGTTLTVGEGVPENGSFTIDVTNKLESVRYHDDKDTKDNLIALIVEFFR